jgi:RNA polymerase sigma factor (sigma-70 family)
MELGFQNSDGSQNAYKTTEVQQRDRVANATTPRSCGGKMKPEETDRQLVSRCGEHDVVAFSTIVMRYSSALIGLIRAKVNDEHHAEDIYQETLTQAWKGLSQGTQVAQLRPWLLGIARNRCHDFYRSPARRDRPQAFDDLERTVNRWGRAMRQHPEAIQRLRQAIEILPKRSRELLSLYYLKGLSIPEIAQRTAAPRGTIQRQIHEARQQIREHMEAMVELLVREEVAVYGVDQSADTGFPRQRPEIRISPTDIELFSVDCRELRWWFLIPQVGEQSEWATYEGDDWRLSQVSRAKVIGSARIDNHDAVEIRTEEWSPEPGWSSPGRRMFARLGDDLVQWLGVEESTSDGVEIRTRLDAGFEEDWGSVERTLIDQGKFRAVGRDVYTFDSEVQPTGAGVSQVAIGERSFLCLRVLELGPAVGERPGEKSVLIEGFIDRTGRTILSRRYNARMWAVSEGSPWSERPWDERLPECSRLVIDGVVFIHWYDCLSARAVSHDET